MSDIQNTDTLTTVKTILNDLLNALGENERTTVRDLIDKVVNRAGVRVSIANGLVPMLLQQWVAEGHGRVERGRAGGVFKGEKKVRVDPRPRCNECHQVLRKTNE